MDVAYLDTTVLLRILFNEPYSKVDLSPYKKLVSSELICIESARRLNNMRLNQELTDEEFARHSEKLERMLGEVDQILLSRPILAQALQATSVKVQTLDYLHLCSALFYRQKTQERLVFLTHDKQLANAAIVSGLSVLGGTEDYFRKSAR